MITSLKPNEVFVFGSNTYGNHAGGAARQAVESFGAIDGLGVGPQGQSYAIPTLDWQMQKLPLPYIHLHIKQFLEYAHDMPHKTFLVTAIGTGIAGYGAKEIKVLWDTERIPPNVQLPEEFVSM